MNWIFYQIVLRLLIAILREVLKLREYSTDARHHDLLKQAEEMAGDTWKYQELHK